MKHNKPLKIVLLLSWITYVTAYLCRVNLSTVLDKLSVGLNVSMEFLGIASSVYFVTYAVGQLINGFLDYLRQFKDRKFFVVGAGFADNIAD